MLIPLRTDYAPRRTPIVTQWLLVINLAVYALGLAAEYGGLFELSALVSWGALDPENLRLRQFITYQFMHDPGAIWHLLFNMLFLWVFGCPVEDRLGRAGFLGFYLIAGVTAGVAHLLVTGAAVIGASGAICGLTGAFLALFPRSRILVLFLIFPMILPALWIIGLYFVLDLLRQVQELFGAGTSRVAYAAHLSGYLYGFGVGFMLLAMRIVKHEDVDVFYLWKQARRRRAFRAAAQQSHGAIWDGPTKQAAKHLQERATAAKQEQTKAKRPERTSQEEDRILELRALIAADVDRHDLAAAARHYRDLLTLDRHNVLSESRQLDIANQLYADNDAEQAARAYEVFLNNYPRSNKADEVRLMLGLIYARRLDKPQRARPLLERARANIVDEAHRRLAEQLLGELAT